MRTCEDGCNGCEECTDYEDDDVWCERCNNDGRDPWNDYLLPCPACQGEQIAAGFLAQIEACKRDVAAWPDWMKQTATVPPWMASHATDL